MDHGTVHRHVNVVSIANVVLIVAGVVVDEEAVGGADLVSFVRLVRV
jgi:hypothetical protein